MLKSYSKESLHKNIKSKYYGRSFSLGLLHSFTLVERVLHLSVTRPFGSQWSNYKQRSLSEDSRTSNPTSTLDSAPVLGRDYDYHKVLNPYGEKVKQDTRRKEPGLTIGVFKGLLLTPVVSCLQRLKYLMMKSSVRALWRTCVHYFLMSQLPFIPLP